MEITDTQYRHIAPCLPTPRGNVTLDNLHVLNAILYVAEQGCKWRALPKRFGNWHTILYAHESLVEERGAGSCRCPVATGSEYPRNDRSRGVGQYHRQGPSRWYRGIKKTARKPLADPAADGRPRFIWLPRMLERP